MSFYIILEFSLKADYFKVAKKTIYGDIIIMSLSQKNNTSAFKGNIILGIFSLVILLFYPLVYPKVFGIIHSYYAYLLFITLPLLSMLSFAGILIYSNYDSLRNDFVKYRYMYVVVIILAIIVFIGNFFRGSGLFEIKLSNFFASLAIVIIPFFIRIMVNEINFQRWLAELVLWFYFANVFIVIIGRVKGRFAYGLPGNTNWQASLAIILLPLIFYYIVKWVPKKINYWGGHFIIMALFCAISSWLVLVANSKGAILAIGAGVFFYITGCFCNKSTKKTIVLSGFMGMFLLVVGTIVALKMDVKLIDNDIRSHLWNGTVNLLMDDYNYIFGIPGNAGNGMFETAFSSYNSPEYYLSKIASGRNNHPHNQLLYIFVSYGIVGGICLFSFIFYIFGKLFVKFNELSFYIKAILISALMLLVHGMVDLVLHEWPTNILFLIFMGILIAEIFKFKIIEKKEQKQNSILYNALIVGLLGTFCYQFYYSVEASINDRSGKIASEFKKSQDANDYYVRSVNEFPRPRAIYDAMSNAFYNLKNIALVQYYGEKFADCGVKNFSHNNLLMGVASAEFQDYSSAVKYLEQERVNYPADVMPLVLLCYLYEKKIKDHQFYLVRYDQLLKVLALRIKDDVKRDEFTTHLTTLINRADFSAYRYVFSYYRRWK